MNIITIVIIIISALVLGAIVVVSVVVAIKKKAPAIMPPTSGCSNCSAAQICINDTCVLPSQCILGSIKELIPCSPDNPCQCTDFNCITVDDDNPYYSAQGRIPNGNWCLPNITQGETCNNLTSDTVLYNNGTNYAWGCRCKLNFITHNTSAGNCNVVEACGGDANIFYVPSLYETPPNCSGVENNGKCWVKWIDNQNINPTSGECIGCPQGKAPYKYMIGENTYIIDCVADSCAAGGGTKVSDGECRCPEGTVRCPQDIPDSGTKTQCLYSPTCIPDACEPGGKWNINTQTCDCNPPYARKATENNIFRYICGDPCYDNGPCGSRGTCYLDKTETKCKDCQPPFRQDETDMCEDTCLLSGTDCYDKSACCSGKCSFKFFVNTCD